MMILLLIALALTLVWATNGIFGPKAAKVLAGILFFPILALIFIAAINREDRRRYN